MYAQAWQWNPRYYCNSNELYHHGIMGQRWGKRNGPPYPLAPGDHSAAESRLKGKNEGKLESWKAKESAKVSKYYDKKISKAKTTAKRESLANKKEREVKAIEKMHLDDLKAERISKGKAIVKGLLKYAVISNVRSTAMKGAAISASLGNIPLAMVFSAINFAATIPQMHTIVKAISRRRTTRADTYEEDMERSRKEKAITYGIIAADTLLAVLSNMLGPAYVGPRLAYLT